MSIRQKIEALQKQLDALKVEIAKPEEVPPVWFMPKDGEAHCAIGQDVYGVWTYNKYAEHRRVACTHPVLHPRHIKRWCEAMNTLAKLRADSDGVVEGKYQCGVAARGGIVSFDSAEAKYVYCQGIVKDSEEALLDFLAKHNTTPKAVAKMVGYVNGNKTVGDW